MDNLSSPNRERSSHRIGVLGGTFDPIHEGHLLIAESAVADLRLDKVIFIPAGRPWLKPDSPVADAPHRLAMVKLATQNNPSFEVSDIEIKRPGNTYTADTLAELRQIVEPPAKLYLILGMDSIRELPRWHQPDLIFKSCSVVAVSRPGVADVAARKLECALPSSKGKILAMSGPMINTSSTNIRSRIARNKSLDSLPVSVRDYIRENALYANRLS